MMAFSAVLSIPALKHFLPLSDVDITDGVNLDGLHEYEHYAVRITQLLEESLLQLYIPAPELYLQLERTSNGLHLHILIKHDSLTKTNAGSLIPNRVVNLMSTLCPSLDWNTFIQMRKRYNSTSKRRALECIDLTSFILNYFYKKDPPTLESKDCYLFANTNIGDFVETVKHSAVRQELFKVNSPSIVDDDSITPSMSVSNVHSTISENMTLTKSQVRFTEMVNWLVAKGITSEKQWMKENRQMYISLCTSGAGKQQIKRAVDLANEIMITDCNAVEYATGTTVGNIKNNRIYKIFELNGYDPAHAACIFHKWLSRETGKRNTIWLYGPATTGKTNIAQALAYALPSYGNVNWTNENFPFNDCAGKMLIWWEEGKMTTQIVEVAKALLGGTKCHIDKKCKDSVEIDSTPVIITSNTNMTICYDGNQYVGAHREPLEERIFKFTLGVKLDPLFGLTTKEEIKEWFYWGSLQTTPLGHAHIVPTVRGIKRGAVDPLFSVFTSKQQSGLTLTPAPVEKKLKKQAYVDIDIDKYQDPAVSEENPFG